MATTKERGSMEFYGRTVDLLDRINTEDRAIGAVRRAARDGDLREKYEDVCRYILYVESLTDPVEHQLLRMKWGKRFCYHAAHVIAFGGK